MEITPGVGIDRILFGLTRDETRQLLGEPERSDQVTVEQSNWIEWHYDSQGLSVYFDSESDNRLVTIDVDDPAVEIEGFKPIGLDEEHVLEVLKGIGPVDFEDELPDLNRRVYSLRDTEVWFWFQDGRCDSVQVSAFSEEEE